MKLSGKILKKTTAALTAAFVVTAAPSAVWAASYLETEQAAVQGFAEELASGWEKEMEASVKELEERQTANLTLNLEESATHVLYLLSGMDFSWLESIGMNIGAAMTGDLLGGDVELTLNGASVVSLKEYMDLAGGMIYAQIPELFEGVMQIPMTMTGSAGTGDNSVSAFDPESVSALFEAIRDPYTFLPDGKTVSDILNRYADIVLANMEEGDTYEETLQAGELSADCTVYEGRLAPQALVDTYREILTTAKEDEQLLEVIRNYADVMMMGDVTAQFQAAMDHELEALDTTPPVDPEQTGYVFSRIRTDADGRIVGREIGVNNGTDTTTFLTWNSLEQDGATALQLSVSSGYDVFSLEGSGTTDGDMKAGEYRIYLNGLPVVSIAVSDYSLQEDGSMTGSYRLALEPGMPDDETYNTLGAYSLTFDITSDVAAGTSDMTLGLYENDTFMGSLSLSGKPDGEPEAFDLESLGTVYDFSDENAVNAFVESLDYSVIFENLTAAGVPDELVQAVQQLIAADPATSGGAQSTDDSEATYTFSANADSMSADSAVG